MCPSALGLTDPAVLTREKRDKLHLTYPPPHLGTDKAENLSKLLSLGAKTFRTFFRTGSYVN
jgi:hypothetical protein